MASDASVEEATQEKARVEESLKMLVSSVGLFSGFPEALIQDIKNASNIVRAMPDEIIMRQGEMNKNLYFLLIGTIDVLVDGGHVATLRRKGDLLGEMSVITKKPGSATIVAKTPVEMICLNTENFANLTANKDQYEHVLYRIYSTILTDKLYITNQKAKRLEETLSALERAKNELQEINIQLERRVASRTQSLQAKLEELMKNQLGDLKKTLSVAVSDAKGELHKRLEQAILDVDSALQVIEPIVQRFNMEVSLKNKKVLLAQSERKSQTMSKMALGGTGIQIFPATNAEEATKLMAENDPDLVLFDLGSLPYIQSTMRLGPKKQFIMLLDSDMKESLAKLNDLEKLPNLVTVNEADKSATVTSVMKSVTKLLSTDMFGIEKYLSLGSQIEERKIVGSKQRAVLNEEMSKYFSKLGVRKTVIEQAAIVSEELLMNAIYDAPVDERGESKYNMLPRTTAVELLAKEQGIMRYGCDGNLLAVSIEDPFGVLTSKTVLKYLESCYSGKAGELQKDKGGAGRGLHQIVENSEFVVFNVKRNFKTEAIAFFNMVPGERVEKIPMLHFFS